MIGFVYLLIWYTFNGFLIMQIINQFKRKHYFSFGYYTSLLFTMITAWLHLLHTLPVG